MSVYWEKNESHLQYTLNLSNYQDEIEQQICEESYKMSGIKMKSNKYLLGELQNV